MTDITGIAGQYGEVAAQVIGRVQGLRKRLDSCHANYATEHATIHEELGILQAEINEVAAVLRNHINIDEMVHAVEEEELAALKEAVIEEAIEIQSIEAELHAIAKAVCEDARPTVLQMTNTVTGSKRPLMLVDSNLIDKMKTYIKY